MTINKIETSTGTWYFVCILNQRKAGWGRTIKSALEDACK